LAQPNGKQESVERAFLESRRADSNRGPLHYEGTPTRETRVPQRATEGENVLHVAHIAADF